MPAGLGIGLLAGETPESGGFRRGRLSEDSVFCRAAEMHPRLPPPGLRPRAVALTELAVRVMAEVFQSPTCRSHHKTQKEKPRVLKD